jgi:hypothetical protein
MGVRVAGPPPPDDGGDAISVSASSLTAAEGIIIASWLRVLPGVDGWQRTVGGGRNLYGGVMGVEAEDFAVAPTSPPFLFAALVEGCKTADSSSECIMFEGTALAVSSGAATAKTAAVVRWKLCSGGSLLVVLSSIAVGGESSSAAAVSSLAVTLLALLNDTALVGPPSTISGAIRGDDPTLLDDLALALLLLSSSHGDSIIIVV